MFVENLAALLNGSENGIATQSLIESPSPLVAGTRQIYHRHMPFDLGKAPKWAYEWALEEVVYGPFMRDAMCCCTKLQGGDNIT